MQKGFSSAGSLKKLLPETKSTAFLIIASIAIVLQSFFIFLFLFEPGLPYKVFNSSATPLASDQFSRLLENVTNSRLQHQTRVKVLTNGEEFYPEALSAIRAARHSVNLEAYIFQEGEISKQFLDALTERARAGVSVNLVLDAVGSLTTGESYFEEFRAAGGRTEWYHPFRWDRLGRYNNRTHRELIIVDGKIGFIGGPGIADHWFKGDDKNPRWRDSMFRVEGDAVTGLQATFAGNWLEASGEILVGDEYFPQEQTRAGTPALVVESSPSAGRSTKARALFQTVIASATKTIHLATPYFLPDISLRKELVRAVKERGVEVKILTAGGHYDQYLTRKASRRVWGDLLQAGVEIYEYQPSMMHAKILIVDGLWCVVGSTNLDSRSFGLNDEANLATPDKELYARLREDFERDLSHSREMTYDNWKRRPFWQRFEESFGGVLERQQ